MHNEYSNHLILAQLFSVADSQITDESIVEKIEVFRKVWLLQRYLVLRSEFSHGFSGSSELLDFERALNKNIICGKYYRYGTMLIFCMRTYCSLFRTLFDHQSSHSHLCIKIIDFQSLVSSFTYLEFFFSLDFLPTSIRIDANDKFLSSVVQFSLLIW